MKMSDEELKIEAATKNSKGEYFLRDGRIVKRHKDGSVVMVGFWDTQVRKPGLVGPPKGGA